MLDVRLGFEDLRGKHEEREDIRSGESSGLRIAGVDHINDTLIIQSVSMRFWPINAAGMYLEEEWSTVVEEDRDNRANEVKSEISSASFEMKDEMPLA